MAAVLLDQVIYTDYGQFDLTWDGSAGFDGDFDRLFHDQVNGLAGAAHPGGLYLNFARRHGGSPLRIERRDREPEPETGYQDVVEVSVVIPPGERVMWSSWGGETSGSLPGLDDGEYRVRISGRDRDRGHEDEAAEHPVDAYLVQFWPAPAAPDAILAVGSEDAKYWHRSIGGRR